MLLVCEGYAERELAKFIAEQYLPRNCGTVLQTRNAFGNGGGRALELALELQQQTAHDRYGVFVDTDTHWDADCRRRAAATNVICIENDPCIEATLLAVDGLVGHQQDYKRIFREKYGKAAHAAGVIARNFSRQKFDDARGRVQTIDGLLRLIRC